MRVRKLLALTLAIMLVLGSFTFALGVGVNLYAWNNDNNQWKQAANDSWSEDDWIPIKVILEPGNEEVTIVLDYKKESVIGFDDMRNFYIGYDGSSKSATIIYNPTITGPVIDGDFMNYHITIPEEYASTEYALYAEVHASTNSSQWSSGKDLQIRYDIPQGRDQTVSFGIKEKIPAPTYGISVTKEATTEDTPVYVGDTISYEIVVTNNSSVRLDDIVVVDPMFPGLESPITLESGQYRIYNNMTKTALEEGTLSNTVTVSSDTGQVSDTATADVTVENVPTQYGTLTIAKELWMDGEKDTDDNTSFNYYVEGTNLTASGIFSVNSPEEIELPVGTYTVSETVYGSYTPDFTTTEVSITTDGETVTFINRYETPPGDTGTITFVKEVTGVVDDETLFQVNITGPGDYTNTVYVSETTPVAITGLLEGEYEFTEVVPEGYKGINYSGSANVGGNYSWTNTVNLLNWKLGEIVVEKEIEGEQLNTDFVFRLFKALEGEDQLITEGAVSISNPVTITNLEPGEYYINEDPEIVGYLTPKPEDVFQLAAGQTLTRTLINYQHPKLTIDKSVDDSLVAIGEEVTYTIEVTNLGGFDLPEVEIRDDRFGFITTTAIDSGDTFTHTITTSYPTSGSKYNEATASASGIIIYGEDGIYVDPDELDVHVAGEIIYDLMVQDDVTVVVNEEPVPDEPSVNIEKVADDYSVYINEDVTYTITVTNDGDVTLYDLLIEDTNLGYATTLASLAPGAEFSDSLTTSYGSTGDKVNTASVTAYFELDLDYDSEISNELYDEDSVTVDVNRRSTPSNDYEMEIEKTALEDEVELGDVANFRIVVRNTGDGTLRDIRVVDDMTGLDETITLGEKESEIFNVSVVTDEVGTLTNTAEATHSRASFARDSDSVEVVLEDEDIPEGVPGTYEIEIEKEAVTEDDIFSGDMVEFKIVVKNTGDEIVTNIMVEDDMVDFEAVIDELQPGESEEFTVMVEAPNIPGPFTNTATATSSETGTVEADDTVFVEQPVPLDVPDTGVAPTELFFGLGALVSGLGLAITKKRRR